MNERQASRYRRELRTLKAQRRREIRKTIARRNAKFAKFKASFEAFNIGILKASKRVVAFWEELERVQRESARVGGRLHGPARQVRGVGASAPEKSMDADYHIWWPSGCP